MGGAHHAEVAVVERRDGGLVVAFGDDAGVGGVEAQVGVGGDELADACPVLAGEGIDLDFAIRDGAVEAASAVASSSRRISQPASVTTSEVVTSGPGWAWSNARHFW